MSIKKLNEQFSQSFDGDGFNSSNGVFQVKYKPYEDLSQPRGRDVNPYDHITGEEIQTGDQVKARVKGIRESVIGVVVSVKRTANGKGSIYKIRDISNSKIYNLPSFAVELYQDNGNVITAGNRFGGTASARLKFLTALKYQAGNFVWNTLESKGADSKEDPLLQNVSNISQRESMIDPSIKIILIDSNTSNYEKYIDDFKKDGLVHIDIDNKNILINRDDEKFSKINDSHLLVIDATGVANILCSDKGIVDDKYIDILAAQFLRNKGYKNAYKIIASNFEKKHGVSYGACADEYVPQMKEYL